MPADVRKYPIFNFPFGIPVLDEEKNSYFDEIVKDVFSDEEIQFIKDTFRKIKEKSIFPLLATSPEEAEDNFITYFETALPYFLQLGAIYSSPDKITKFSEKSIKVEQQFYENLKTQIPESLFEIFEALNNTSLLMYSNIVEKGVKDFIEIVIDRAQDEFMELGYYYMITNFGFITCLIALKENRGSAETVDRLKGIVSTCADELDSYLSTVDLLLSDEDYEVLKNYM